MGKGKKRKQQDFQKTKLKVGAKKHKVDELAFKTRHITVLQSVKEKESVGGKQLFDVPTLLSHCKHHSAGMRQKALQGLLGHFENEAARAQFPMYHMGKMADQAFALVADDEALVREAARTLLRRCLVLLSADKYAAFSGTFDVIGSHISSAMLSLQPQKRQDGLKAFDLMMELCPDVTIRHAGRLVSIFLACVTGSLSSHPSSQGPLLLKSSGQTGTWEGKAGMLGRVQKVLEQTLQALREDDKEPELPRAGLQCLREIQLWALPLQSSPMGFIRVAKDWQRLKESLGPLITQMLQYWVESCPYSADSGVSLSAASITALNSMAHILLAGVQVFFKVTPRLPPHETALFRRYKQPVPNDWLRGFYKDLVKTVMRGFPYSVQEPPPQSTQGKRVKVPQAPVTSLNMAVCSLLGELAGPGEMLGEEVVGWLPAATTFLQSLLQRSMLNPGKQDAIVAFFLNLVACPHPQALKALKTLVQIAWKQFLDRKASPELDVFYLTLTGLPFLGLEIPVLCPMGMDTFPDYCLLEDNAETAALAKENVAQVVRCLASMDNLDQRVQETLILHLYTSTFQPRPKSHAFQGLQAWAGQQLRLYFHHLFCEGSPLMRVGEDFAFKLCRVLRHIPTFDREVLMVLKTLIHHPQLSPKAAAAIVESVLLCWKNPELDTFYVYSTLAVAYSAFLGRVNISRPGQRVAPLLSVMMDVSPHYSFDQHSKIMRAAKFRFPRTDPEVHEGVFKAHLARFEAVPITSAMGVLQFWLFLRYRAPVWKLQDADLIQQLARMCLGATVAVEHYREEGMDSLDQRLVTEAWNCSLHACCLEEERDGKERPIFCEVLRQVTEEIRTSECVATGALVLRTLTKCLQQPDFVEEVVCICKKHFFQTVTDLMKIMETKTELKTHRSWRDFLDNLRLLQPILSPEEPLA